ncbi:hypothetical protein SPRG_19033 [Saprolegnia parasitica CBS 223.65]|uniref:FYVE-type domain-containing protein n=1 Tax=Saprolegnia parasitica (strain CBS 223.65) TaxID=695850 RepID=A0A067D5C7_SAPPC|nr:hypothetical protein SPRG_19033 [Saprolegnia parasitica CBS 223.65]KDO34187.1 hypothetical protein SPRG_19033 [Saprolegnia parasitica CBS 223.65]|eukprot:XP_012195232.1 hypothetical protein SPRG_19033 [Saprolegnia parasitica CBS 223.65]
MPLKTGHPIFVEQLRPQYTWVPNATRSVCYLCKRRFGLFRHKKNCRVCGEVVCSSCTQKKQSVVLDVTGFTKTRVCFACIVACTLPPAGSSIADRHQVHPMDTTHDCVPRGSLLRTSSHGKHRQLHHALVPHPAHGPTIRAENGAILRQSYIHLTPKAWDYEHFGNNFVDTARKTETRPTSIRYSDILGKGTHGPIKLLESEKGSPTSAETRNTLVLQPALPQPLLVAEAKAASSSPTKPTSMVLHLQHDMTYGYPLDFDWDFAWPKPPTVAFEKQRLDELFNFDILDGKQDDVLDIICDLAAQRLEAPLAAVSFIDHDHQYFKASTGWRIADVPRNQAFCAHVLRIKAPLAVNDTRLDARFDQNPLVTGPHAVRSYLAAPILSPVSHLVLGTVFIMDTEVRTFSSAQIDTIERLAIAAASHIDSHKYHSKTAAAPVAEKTTVTEAKAAATIEVPTETTAKDKDMAVMLQGLLQKTTQTQQEVATRGSAMSHTSSEAFEVD